MTNMKRQEARELLEYFHKILMNHVDASDEEYLTITETQFIIDLARTGAAKFENAVKNGGIRH